MIPEWVAEELKTVDLGDKRCDKRFKRVLAEFATQPTISIPAAVGGGRAETEAAYRFFENDHFDFGDVLTPHCDATLERIRAEKLIVLAQDTTEMDVTRPQQQVQDAGPLDAGSRRGSFLHEVHAFTETGLSIGTVAAQVWARTDLPRSAEDKALREKQRKQTPIEDKESYRWVEGMHRAHLVAAQAPNTEVVLVSDSEGDIYEMLDAAQFPETQSEPTSDESGVAPPRAHFIVRACQDRALQPANVPENPWSEEDGTAAECFTTILPKVAAGPVLDTYEVQIRGRESKVSCETRGRRQARQSRTGIVEVRACSVILQPPPRPDRKLPAVKLNVVFVREVNPPAGEEPVDWLLLTTLPIDTLQAVMRVIEIYKVRWQIEIFFRVLKQGCRLEARRFETLDNFWHYLAVALVISWRTMYLMRMGRDFPEMSCDCVFEVSEWKSV